MNALGLIPAFSGFVPCRSILWRHFLREAHWRSAVLCDAEFLLSIGFLISHRGLQVYKCVFCVLYIFCIKINTAVFCAIDFTRRPHEEYKVCIV